MRRTIYSTALIGAALVGATPVFADNTALDTTFAANGRANYTYAGANYFRTLAHLPRPGGGSVAIVYFLFPPDTCQTGRICFGLYPFASSGSALPPLLVDPSLNVSTIGGAAIDSQGRIVLVGSRLQFGADRDFRVIRLLPNGSADTSFSSDGEVEIAFDRGGNNGDYAHAVAIDAQDRIVVVGQVQKQGSGLLRGPRNCTLTPAFPVFVTA